MRHKSKTKQDNSTKHANMRFYVRKKHTICDIYLKDFEKTIYDCIITNILKFPIFRTILNFDINGKIMIYKIKRPWLYSFNNQCFYYLYNNELIKLQKKY